MELGKLLIDEQFLPAAQNLISKAEKSIYITTFKAEITTKPRGRNLRKFFDTVIEKARLGLDVRFITNKVVKRGAIPFTNLYAIHHLQRHGVKVRCLRNDRICHAKQLLADETVAILGSHNLSVKSCHNNFEVSYIFQDIYIVGQLYGIYQETWDNAQRV